MDTTKKDHGPVQDYSTAYAIYYVSFVVVFSFFFLNIFVALIILTFQDLGEKEISNCELDRNQVGRYLERKTDGRTDRRTGRTDRLIDRQTDRQKERKID